MTKWPNDHILPLMTSWTLTLLLFLFLSWRGEVTVCYCIKACAANCCKGVRLALFCPCTRSSPAVPQRHVFSTALVFSSCLQLLFLLLFQQKGPLLINFFHSLRAFCEQNADFAIRYGNWKIAESTTKRLFSSPISVKNSSKQLRNKHFFRLAKTFPKPPDFVTFFNTDL